MSAPIRLPSGVRDFLPSAAARRVAVASRTVATFEAWGYERIITPVFECADVLERGLGHDARAAAIRFVEPGTGELVALRPDITAQVARLVATRLADHEAPVRLCYEGAVYRVSGRLADELGQREILQAGIELVGSSQSAAGSSDADQPVGDGEVLAIASAVLADAGAASVLEVGHVAPLRAVLAASGEHGDAILVALAKKDRAGLRELARRVPPAIAPLVEPLGDLHGAADATLARARALAWPSEVAAALAMLADVIAAYRELIGDPAPTTAPTLQLDLGDVRGFDYYTGVRFAGFVTGAPDAVLRGGRYDSLIGRFGRPAHATGFAVDIDALAALTAAPPPRAPLIAVHGTGAAALARALRATGLRAVVASNPLPVKWLASAGVAAAYDVAAHRLTLGDGRTVACDATVAAVTAQLSKHSDSSGGS